MVFEIVREDKKHKISEEETPSGNQRTALLTATGKILPAAMLVVIVVFIAMSLMPYAAGIAEFFYNAFAVLKAFFISVASSTKAFLGI